jgi:hypothetical protein
MKAYLKRSPNDIGEIAHVYTTDFGQKRFTVEYEYGTVVDDAAEEFEVVDDENDN